MGKLVRKRNTYGGSVKSANKISFDNSSGAVSASNVQDAIEEISEKVSENTSSIATLNDSLEKQAYTEDYKERLVITADTLQDFMLQTVKACYDAGIEYEKEFRFFSMWSGRDYFNITCTLMGGGYVLAEGDSSAHKVKCYYSVNADAFVTYTEYATNSDLDKKANNVVYNIMNGETLTLTDLPSAYICATKGNNGVAQSVAVGTGYGPASTRHNISVLIPANGIAYAVNDSVYGLSITNSSGYGVTVGITTII